MHQSKQRNGEIKIVKRLYFIRKPRLINAYEMKDVMSNGNAQYIRRHIPADYKAFNEMDDDEVMMFAERAFSALKAWVHNGISNVNVKSSNDPSNFLVILYYHISAS